ncbi:MgtC/SapB family protein [Halochromatium salexigens]|uniref:DUF4010 domain-containing protein n=1 Tax=Halochromatium salexigens TaxID=49447 RepID=A0AAJ0UEY1_HALSE|nr:DUF4010 domain-containing protein [Halochromatium salexigens]MBK5930204.1 hypothetical protein [Halochromatium salexigens]
MNAVELANGDALELQWAWRLAVALAIGLLVGLERGWQSRDQEEGERGLGLRSMALVGLIGGLAGLLVEPVGGVLVGFVVLGLGLLLSAAHVASVHRCDDLGLTTEVAALATLLLAVMAGLGQLVIAAAGAVIMVLLLGYKTELHGWLKTLKRPELHAAFKLLLISVVVLPLLPNRGFGPWQVLNPYEIWWMVVLIATISFVGYFAIRIAGARKGMLFIGLFGGLASSTATTLNLARLHRDGAGGQAAIAAAGILLACATMFPRMLLVASLLHPPLFWPLLWPVVAMSVLLYLPAVVYVWRSGSSEIAADLLPRNPLELKAALFFGALLALVMLLGQALTDWFGDAGIYALAAASGIADVDAITLSLARMAGDELLLLTAGIGILIASLANSLLKAGMAWIVGGHALGLRVFLPMGAAVLAGPIILLR